MSMLEMVENRFGSLDEVRARVVLLLLERGPPGLRRQVKAHGSAKRTLDSRNSPGGVEARGLLELVQKEFRLLDENEIELLAPGQPGWPGILDSSVSPPALLYVKGDLARAAGLPSLALVGSRRMADYGMRVAHRFAVAWASMGGSVISGGAIGVDAAAHEGSLAGNGPTVVVLGSGLNERYPAQNHELFTRILEEGGALVSELPMLARPQPFNFPQRNRIIAGLSRVVIIVQARKGSGALYTATFALKSDRLLYTVPAPVDDESCTGGVELLAQGVPAITGTSRLVSLFLDLGGVGRPVKPELPLAVAHRPAVSLSRLDKTQRLVLESLSQGTTHMDDLAARLDMTAAALSLILLELEMKKWVVKKAGNHYLCVVRLER